MDKLPSSQVKVDCRIKRRSLYFRMIMGESGCSRVMDWPISKTVGLLP